MSDPSDLSTDEYDEIRAQEAEAFVLALVNAMLATGPDEPLNDRARRLLHSVAQDIGRDLPDDLDVLVRELIYRAQRPTILVGAMAKALVAVLRAGEAAGLHVHLELLRSPYDALLEIDQDAEA